MTASFWAMVMLCHGVGGGEPCLTHYVGPLDAYTCPRTVAALKLELGTEHGWCTSNLPQDATPLPAAAGATNAAASGSSCAPTATISKNLHEKWGEAPVWMGLSNHGVLMQLWRNGNTSWTIVAALPNRTSCVVAAGKQSLDTAASGSPISMRP